MRVERWLCAHYKPARSIAVLNLRAQPLSSLEDREASCDIGARRHQRTPSKMGILVDIRRRGPAAACTEKRQQGQEIVSTLD